MLLLKWFEVPLIISKDWIYYLHIILRYYIDCSKSWCRSNKNQTIKQYNKIDRVYNNKKGIKLICRRSSRTTL